MKGVKLLREGGAITAATSSQICDGASGVMVVNERGLKALGVEPLARIHHMTVTGGDPVIMLEEPVFATRRALQKSGMKIEEIDLYEVNEAFAAVPMKFMKEMGLPADKVNVNGGAIAMGHPLGATGAMILNTLIDELHRRQLRYGLATLCVGGGMGIATIVERV